MEAKWFDFWPVSILSVLLELQFRSTQTTAPAMSLKYMICAWLFAIFLPAILLSLQHQLNVGAHKSFI